MANGTVLDGFKAVNYVEWQSAGMIVVVCLHYINIVFSVTNSICLNPLV